MPKRVSETKREPKPVKRGKKADSESNGKSLASTTQDNLDPATLKLESDVKREPKSVKSGKKSNLGSVGKTSESKAHENLDKTYIKREPEPVKKGRKSDSPSNIKTSEPITQEDLAQIPLKRENEIKLEPKPVKKTKKSDSQPKSIAQEKSAPISLKLESDVKIEPKPTKTRKTAKNANTTKNAKKADSPSESKPSESLPTDSLSPVSQKLESDAEYDFPWFTLPQNIKDREGRRPDHPEYDSSTIFVPPTEKFTPSMAQYWGIKSMHWDKIVLYQVQKWYETYYQDAVTIQRLLEINWWGNPRKARIGFLVVTLDKYASILIKNGHGVVVVEQVESGKKAVVREVTEIYSKATFPDRGEYMGSDPRYLLSFYVNLDKVGFCLGDCSTSTFLMGVCTFDEFQTLLAQTRPAEVIYHPGFTPIQLIKIIKNSPLPPALSPLRDSDAWSRITLQEIFNLELPSIVSSLQEDAVQALAGCCSYLKKVLLSDSHLKFGQFIPYSHEAFNQTSLIMDSKALEHLEILEARLDDKPSLEGSLLHFLDKTTTSFGKRLFKRWVCAPLFKISEIEARLDAVQELSRNWDAVDSFNTLSKNLPDIERYLNRLSTYCAKSNNKVYYFTESSSRKIAEFSTLLDNLCKLEQIMLKLSPSFECFRLRKIACFEPEGDFPEIKSVCSEFYNRVIWIDGVPEPVPGAYPLFDYCKVEIETVKKDLEDYLELQRDRLESKAINFAHVKHRFELEVPKDVVEGKKKPADYELTSGKNGFERFHTQTIRSLVYELDVAEAKLEEQKKPFVIQLLRDFCQHIERWRKAIMSVAELDCLCSLAKLIQKSSFNVTRPRFICSDSQYLKISSLVHPVLAHNKPDFVPNDIQFSSEHNCMILTGPNMGGKSTLLRQVALAVIMAQLGSFVPAEEMIISPVDRIFTRLGAGDCLLEAKSTFQLEMEEASKVFKQGTHRSLVIMDELGRGTSTYDGAALAFAYLKELTQTLSPRTLFTTHYHMLISKIENLPRVQVWHMNALVSSQESVTFLYKLKEGACPSSYGLNLARLAEVPRAVVSCAKTKAVEIEKILMVKQVISSLTALKSSNPANIRMSLEKLEF